MNHSILHLMKIQRTQIFFRTWHQKADSLCSVLSIPLTRTRWVRPVRSSPSSISDLLAKVFFFNPLNPLTFLALPRWHSNLKNGSPYVPHKMQHKQLLQLSCATTFMLVRVKQSFSDIFNARKYFAEDRLFLSVRYERIHSRPQNFTAQNKISKWITSKWSKENWFTEYFLRTSRNVLVMVCLSGFSENANFPFFASPN